MQQRHQKQGVHTRRFGAKKIFGKYPRPCYGKARPNLGGAYRVTSIAGVSTYWLEDLDEKHVARPWNVFNLKNYYL